MFVGQSGMDSEKVYATTQMALEMDDTPMPEEPHTLENFSYLHFNPPPKRTLSKALANSIRRRERDIPWSFSKVI